MKRGERKARKAKRDCEEKGGGRRRGDGVCYDEGNKRTARKANKRLSRRVRPVNLFVDTRGINVIYTDSKKSSSTSKYE